MNRLVLILLSLVLLLPAYVLALDLPFGGGGKDKTDEEAVAKKGEARFQVRFKSGGVIEVDNYTVTEDHVIVMMPSGAIYLDKKMVSSIDEVEGPEDETIQTIQIKSAPVPAPAKDAEKRPREVQMPDTGKVDTTPRDDEGHTEQWWQNRVDKLKKQKAEAEKRYSDAEEQWVKADGDLANLNRTVPAPLTNEQKLFKKEHPDDFVQPMTTLGSDYDISRVQDQRGSARVAMDRAKADIEEVDRMLNEVLPEEARKAGAPPGWVR